MGLAQGNILKLVSLVGLIVMTFTTSSAQNQEDFTTSLRHTDLLGDTVQPAMIGNVIIDGKQPSFPYKHTDSDTEKNQKVTQNDILQNQATDESTDYLPGLRMDPYKGPPLLEYRVLPIADEYVSEHPSIGLKDRKNRKSGTWIEYTIHHDNGEVFDPKQMSTIMSEMRYVEVYKHIGNYKNGKKDGEWIVYATKLIYPAMKDQWYLRKKIRYVNGKKEGVETTIHSGKVVKSQYFEKNQPEGNEYEFSLSGDTVLTGSYKNGMKEGIFTHYEKSGDSLVKKAEYKYVNGFPMGSKTYYPSGILKAIVPVSFDGKYTGTMMKYSEGGKLLSEENYYRGGLEGLCNYYFSNGAIHLTKRYKDGTLEGTMTEFYPSGGKKLEVEYKNGFPTNVKGAYHPSGTELKSGNLNEGKGWIFRYNNDGELLKKEKYKNGKLVNEKIYQAF